MPDMHPLFRIWWLLFCLVWTGDNCQNRERIQINAHTWVAVLKLSNIKYLLCGTMKLRMPILWRKLFHITDQSNVWLKIKSPVRNVGAIFFMPQKSLFGFSPGRLLWEHSAAVGNWPIPPPTKLRKYPTSLSGVLLAFCTLNTVSGFHEHQWQNTCSSVRTARRLFYDYIMSLRLHPNHLTTA
jgi:hypothetical protein